MIGEQPSVGFFSICAGVHALPYFLSCCSAASTDESKDEEVSEEFQKLQSELEERDRLAKEKEVEVRSPGRLSLLPSSYSATYLPVQLQRAKQEKERAEWEKVERESRTNGHSGGRPCDFQNAYLTKQAPLEPCCVLVSSIHFKTRLHELKQHFHQVRLYCAYAYFPLTSQHGLVLSYRS